MAVEMGVKIGVNLAIATVAVSALTHLLPYHWSQQEKLREIRTQEKRLEANVNNLRTDFSRNFDPHQTKTIMQEQGYRFDPNQRRVIWNKDTETNPQ
jgi:cell division protein FtsB